MQCILVRLVLTLLFSIVTSQACDVPTVPLDCYFGSCVGLSYYDTTIDTRVGTEVVNGTLQICTYTPCLPCDAYCIFAYDGRFLADGHWTCDRNMTGNGTYPDGTTCTAIEGCCMECDGGEGYIYGEYGQTHTSSQFTCQSGVFTEVAFCEGATLAIWTYFFLLYLLIA